MTSYNRGDVVLVPFPFTDLSAQRQRLALVLSGDRFHQSGHDVVIAAITSQQASLFTDYSLQDWQSAGLLGPSVVRVGKLLTLHKALVRRRLGALTPSDLHEVEKCLVQLLELQRGGP
ncbi:MAG: type II toxin-antitoxin system PemK/MazF family toxin [Candidatus Bipolaricaulota bacterium]|nr:type II toxin-antitoxin system PemK/MazF family toxin [Candidatus Bipolaricaulota bacterium]MDW8141063.1 type II toxin-antitoxin system PemK/MazF family toxin [Candidatus Bipolaricaulota bacterium]